MKILKLKNLIVVTLLTTFLACSEEDPIIEYITIVETVTETVETIVDVDSFSNSTLEGNITSDLTLDKNMIWLLKGRVAVTEGVTLTIPAGTIIKAAAGTGADASTLIIARGSKLNALGTKDSPIIFTSESDNILLGGSYPSNGPSLSVESRGLWGGLIVLGKAPCSFAGDVTELQIEGIPTSDKNGLYGGTDVTDNSGTIQYISIRHGGAEIGEGNIICPYSQIGPNVKIGSFNSFNNKSNDLPLVAIITLNPFSFNISMIGMHLVACPIPQFNGATSRFFCTFI